MLNIFLWTVAIIAVFFFVVGIPAWLFVIFPKYKAWKLGNQEVVMKTLSNGEVVIKTEEGLYFHAVDDSAIPVLVSKEEGERLWGLEDGN